MRQHRIFIIDDNFFVRELIHQNLSHDKGLRVECFDSVEDCMLNTLEKPDLIILDFFLDSIYEKNINAGEAVQLFHDRFPGTDIILISGEINIQLLEQYERVNFIQFMVKSDENYARVYDMVKTRLNKNSDAA